ncbi:MAG: echA8 24 [Mycobacterium sp.]|nr:echA8 24 [Mycobacterium sp.]
MTLEDDQILTRVEGAVGFVTLNRPKAINALTHTMVTTLLDVLTAWAHDTRITAVVLDGAGDRGLCAGGDVVAIYRSARDDGSAARQFWWDEYRLNAFIAAYPKPYVSLMDGIVMGGGVGVAAHGNVRVVTGTSRIAMPEVGIGFIPDVGATYLLSHAPGQTGLHVSLTGAPFTGADAIGLGFADHYVPKGELAAFIATLVAGGVDAALRTHATDPPRSELAQQHWIDECYDRPTIGDIVAALRSHPEKDANDAADLIASRSPIALAVTLHSVRSAAKLGSLEHVLVQEYRTSCAALKSLDLVEGIRAQLIDKDRNPQWSPASVTAIPPEAVAAYFTPLEVDLTFPSGSS